jgi:hypothetical protein
MMRTTFAMLVLSACTGQIGGDEPDPNAPTDVVAVVVRDGTMPVAGVEVIFQGSDDSVIASATTGADGRAAAEMPLGGNVSVIRTYPMPMDPAEERRPDHVYTYVGVQGGDILDVVGELDMTAGTPNAINVKVSDAIDNTVSIETPCGTGEGTGPTIPMTVLGCAAEVPFYVTANNQAFLLRAPLGENVDLSAGVLADALGSSISATNVPLDIESVVVEKRLQADAYEIYSSGTKRIDQTPATVTLPSVSGVDEVLVVAMARTTGGSQVVATRKPYEQGLTIVDASAIARIPYATKVQLAPTGISWTEDGAGAIDFVIAHLDVQRPDPTGGPYDIHFVRTIVAAHAGTNLRLPQLPNARYGVTADDSIGGQFGLVAVTAGWDAVREQVFAHRSVTDLAPMNGSVTVAYWGGVP